MASCRCSTRRLKEAPPFQLIDGGQIFVPGSGLTDEKGNWVIEGYGVDPDIEFDNDPKSEIKGRDPQLEAWYSGGYGAAQDPGEVARETRRASEDY